MNEAIVMDGLLRGPVQPMSSQKKDAGGIMKVYGVRPYILRKM